MCIPIVLDGNKEVTMKFFPMNKGKAVNSKLRYGNGILSILPAKWKRRVLLFVLCNVLSYFFAPGIFYGFWDATAAVASSVSESRVNYQVRRKYGRTAATARKMVNVWKTLPNDINPMNWGR